MTMPKVYHNAWIKSFRLTERETDVLACLLENQSAKKIAAILNIKPKTIETHIFNMMQKLEKHSRASIVEFAQKSEISQELLDHYHNLFDKYEFNEMLKTIKTTIPLHNIVCKISCRETSIKKRLETDLRELNILCFDRKKDVKVIHIVSVTQKQSDTTVDSIAVGETRSVSSQNETLYDVQIQINENYYLTFFEVLSQLVKHPLIEEAMVHFKSNAPISRSSVNSEKQAVMTKWQSVTIMPKKILIVVLVLIVIVSYFGLSILNSDLKDLVRTDFCIPVESKALKRTDILKKIDALFQSRDPIKIVVLVGIGGAGKTTLARQYVKVQKDTVVWEINAETQETLLNSFALLAYMLSKTQEEKLELERIKKTENQQEYAQKLVQFVKQKLRQRNNWFLIFDNIDTPSEIQTFLPTDPTAWGTGKLLITTRNGNIVYQGFIPQSHVILVNELTPQEKLILFLKIQENSADDKKQLRVFLENIPPFPLDVSVAAYHIKNTKNSYDEYLQRLKQKNLKADDLGTIVPPSDMSNYRKTRYQIIACSVDQILKKHEEFAGLLLLVCIVDSQNIPKSLLTQYANSVIVDKFVQQMAQASLLTYQERTSSNRATLSMHRSMQQNILKYLNNHLLHQKRQQYFDMIVCTLEKYCFPLLEQIDSQHMRSIIYHLNSCLDKSEHLGIINRSRIQLLLGSIYCELGNPILAKKFLEPSFIYFKSHYENTECQWLPRVMTYIGFSERLLGNYEIAKQILEKSMIIYRKSLQNNQLEQALILCQLSGIYKFTDSIDKAENAVKNSIELYKRFAPNTLGFSVALSDLAAIYFNKGEYAQAICYRLQSLSIAQKLCGPNHIKTLFIMGLLGIDYRRIGYYDKALDAFKKSYAGLKKYHSDNLNALSIFVIKLGEMYRVLGLYEIAQTFLIEGFEIAKQHFGVTHIHTDWAAIPLGQLYVELGKYEQAKILLEKSLNGHCKHFGIDHEKTANVFHQLGIVYTYLGLYQKAQDCFDKSLQSHIKRYGNEHIDYALVLKDLGWFHFKTNYFSIAEQHLKGALDILQRAHHPECYHCFEYLGDLYTKKTEKILNVNLCKIKQFKEQAHAFYREALNVVRLQFPKKSTHVKRIQNKIKALHELNSSV